MSVPNSAPAVDVERFVRLTDIPLDEAYALLANPRTRLTLHVLSTCASSLSLAGLTEAVATRDDADEHAVRAALSHAVLPKLEAHDVLEYDRDVGKVRLDRPVVAADDPVAALVDHPDSTGSSPSPPRDSAG
ncbi:MULTISPECIES: hypothetical protein [Natrinema]|uniref:DUF7344 domain-containing protein n=1 Tax=Natrinema gari JCM 14663 TaxID=1230459 RepID=L9Z3F4_9EURY|nr:MULTISPECIES: hypothetical protein [Natrinema]AFO57724.1 hypothetical protein NJ7G_2492 [Natrinema sp. J7-2]ELY80421.1 hypothetical protein C486_08460 [Natrinema gari JCM 14663]